jgi:ribosome-associated translation inhibitor RaiA
MKKRITFRSIDHSSVIEDYTNKQLKKIIEFLDNERTPVYLDIVFSPSKLRAHHWVELRIKSPNYDRITSYEGTDFYNTLDRVIDTMYLELREDKKRIKKDDRKMCGRHEDFKKQR